MARKTSKRPAPVAGTRSIQARDVFFAGIGAVSLGRKQVVDAYANGYEGLAELRDSAEAAVRQAGKTVTGKVESLRRQASKTVTGKVASLRRQAAPAKKKVEAFAREAGEQLRERIAPALARFGVAKPAKKRRAPAAKRPAARRRKAA